MMSAMEHCDEKMGIALQQFIDYRCQPVHVFCVYVRLYDFPHAFLTFNILRGVREAKFSSKVGGR